MLFCLLCDLCYGRQLFYDTAKRYELDKPTITRRKDGLISCTIAPNMVLLLRSCFSSSLPDNYSVLFVILSNVHNFSFCDTSKTA